MKYSFTGETKVVFGVTLKQIRAEVSFGIVAKGEIGGWIEKEENLSCVYGNAWVYGDAQVYGDARVYGNAWVYGDAQVYGDARVSGNAQVSGNAWKITPLCIHATKFSVSVSSKTIISIGCEKHTVADWEENGETIGKAHGFTKKEIAEYRLYVDLCKKWMQIYCK